MADLAKDHSGCDLACLPECTFPEGPCARNGAVVADDICHLLRRNGTRIERWAADEITRLREDISRYVARDTERLAEVEKLREALKPFAAITPSSLFPEDGSEAEEYYLLCGKADDVGISNGPDFTGADLARARAVLTGTETPQGDVNGAA